MRVTDCGTGAPITRAAQAAACLFIELRNGDKFLFDIGPVWHFAMSGIAALVCVIAAIWMVERAGAILV
jgi:hypothetical protein